MCALPTLSPPARFRARSLCTGSVAASLARPRSSTSVRGRGRPHDAACVAHHHLGAAALASPTLPSPHSPASPPCCSPTLTSLSLHPPLRATGIQLVPGGASLPVASRSSDFLTTPRCRDRPRPRPPTRIRRCRDFLQLAGGSPGVCPCPCRSRYQAARPQFVADPLG